MFALEALPKRAGNLLLVFDYEVLAPVLAASREILPATATGHPEDFLNSTSDTPQRLTHPSGLRSIAKTDRGNVKVGRRHDDIIQTRYRIARGGECGAGARPCQRARDPAEYKGVLTTLGKTGDFKDGVLKVNIPRNDLKVTIDKRSAPTPFGFGGWVALTKGQGMDVMMGDLVLTEDEVNPVMSALLRERRRRHGAPQSFLLGATAHLLHARARDGQRRRSREARQASD